MPSARKRVNRLAREAADRFKPTILRNRVNEQVSGAFDTEHELTQLVELSEQCYDLSNARGGAVGDEVGSAAFTAAEKLNDQIDAVRDEEMARACAVISNDAGGWGDTWDDDEIADAVRSARTWLSENRDAAERAGVLEAMNA